MPRKTRKKKIKARKNRRTISKQSDTKTRPPKKELVKQQPSVSQSTSSTTKKYQNISNTIDISQQKRFDENKRHVVKDLQKTILLSVLAIGSLFVILLVQ